MVITSSSEKQFLDKAFVIAVRDLFYESGRGNSPYAWRQWRFYSISKYSIKESIFINRTQRGLELALHVENQKVKTSEPSGERTFRIIVCYIQKSQDFELWCAIISKWKAPCCSISKSIGHHIGNIAWLLSSQAYLECCEPWQAEHLLSVL